MTYFDNPTLTKDWRKLETSVLVKGEDGVTTWLVTTHYNKILIFFFRLVLWLFRAGYHYESWKGKI